MNAVSIGHCNESELATAVFHIEHESNIQQCYFILACLLKIIYSTTSGKCSLANLQMHSFYHWLDAGECSHTLLYVHGFYGFTTWSVCCCDVTQTVSWNVSHHREYGWMSRNESSWKLVFFSWIFFYTTIYPLWAWNSSFHRKDQVRAGCYVVGHSGLKVAG